MVFRIKAVDSTGETAFYLRYGNDLDSLSLFSPPSVVTFWLSQSSQAPHNLRVIFQSEIQDAATQAAELVRNLGKDISNMKWSHKTSLLKKVHISTERLQHATDMHSYLFISNSEAINNSYKPFLKQSHTLSTTLHDISNQLPELESNCLVKNSEARNQSAPSETIPPEQLVESYHEMMRRQSRRLHSWPSREVDAFEEEGGPRMRTLESTAAQSLDTFASLLIEFVARFDRLVEAVDELSKMAKFKHENHR